jgi:hypothetical protein
MALRRRRQITSVETQSPNLSAARAFAFAASCSRFLGAAFVSSDRRRRVETPATSSMASRNAASFAFDGLLNPLIFLTNCSEAARISSSVTGGSKLKRVLMFLHMGVGPTAMLTLSGFGRGRAAIYGRVSKCRQRRASARSLSSGEIRVRIRLQRYRRVPEKRQAGFSR